MAITAKLELRQAHSLVMTPQLQQAIKLLQLSNLELAAFVEAELERNPLLERAEPRREVRRRAGRDAESTRSEADARRRRRGDGASDASLGLSRRRWLDLESDDASRAPSSSTPSRKTFTGLRAPAGEPKKQAGRRSAGTARRRRGRQSRSLCRRRADAPEPSRRATVACLRRSGAAADRASSYRHDRRGAAISTAISTASPSCSARRSSSSRKR